jgi:hypothetical protein
MSLLPFKPHLSWSPLECTLRKRRHGIASLAEGLKRRAQGARPPSRRLLLKNHDWICRVDGPADTLAPVGAERLRSGVSADERAHLDGR